MRRRRDASLILFFDLYELLKIAGAAALRYIKTNTHMSTLTTIPHYCTLHVQIGKHLYRFSLRGSEATIYHYICTSAHTRIAVAATTASSELVWHGSREEALEKYELANVAAAKYLVRITAQQTIKFPAKVTVRTARKAKKQIA